MCRLTECCCYMPLRQGCVVASLIEFSLGIIELGIYFTYAVEHEEDQKAANIVELCVIFMCSFLLFIGSVKEERVCIISHCVFLAMGLFGEVICEVIIFKLAFFSYAPDWLIAYFITSHCFLLYMLPIGISYAIELKDHGYYGDVVSLSSRGAHRQMSSILSTEIYGM